MHTVEEMFQVKFGLKKLKVSYHNLKFDQVMGIDRKRESNHLLKVCATIMSGVSSFHEITEA